MFVSKEKIPITLDGNTIFIRAKMNAFIENRVLGAASSVSIKRNDAAVDLGAWNMALLRENILGWEGPAFVDEAGKPIPCTPENIENLDTDEPLVELVLGEINDRNQKRGGGDKAKNSTSAGGQG